MFSKSCFNFDRKVHEILYGRKIFLSASMKRKTTERVKIWAKVSRDFHIIISFSAALNLCGKNQLHAVAESHQQTRFAFE